MSSGKAFLIGLIVAIVIIRDPHILTEIGNAIQSLVGGHG